MSLKAGTRIGAYEVIRPSGAGGMGEVFLARDVRLKRDVALKILSDRHRFDAQRLARFEREAQLLASLNHANIATLHGFEVSGDLQVLVMEYIEGDTLAERLAAGALPVAAAAPIARQLVDALDAAHERGIVHRDLKPANIKIRPDDGVKVLDFGLARALDPAGASGADLPTLTAGERVVLGTPAYMSPEQARGGSVDRRADIWAFGCVLYEMLTGRRAFDGTTGSDAMAAVLTREPDWSALPADVPPALRRLLRRCLEKDPRQRLRDIADPREHLLDESPIDAPAVASPRVPRRSAMLMRRVWMAGTATSIVAVAILAALHFGEAPPRELRLQIETPPTLSPLHFALSPDGRYIVFVASGSSNDAAQRLYLRPLHSLAAQLLAGTDGARVPSFLPDGRQILLYVEGEPEASGLYLGSLAGGALKRLTAGQSPAAYLPPNRVVFVQEGALVARQIDTSRSELTGDPLTLVAAVPGPSTPSGFSTSGTGIVAYRRGGVSQLRTTWLDRAGKALEHIPFMNAPELSRDGRYLAGDRTISGNRDAWVADLVRGSSTRVTAHPAVDGFPVWSPDGARLAFHSQRNGDFDVWMKRVDAAVGTEERVLGTTDNEWPLDWSSDGRFLLYHRTDRNYASSDLWALPMTGTDREPIAVATTPFVERLGQFSPDGRWIAYETDESGRREIVVQSFPKPGAIVHVSTNGGSGPRWSPTGTEIYFVAPDGKMMAVPVTITHSTLTPGDPVALFTAGLSEQQVFRVNYAVARNGRFLINASSDEDAAASITLILNWNP